MLPVTIPDPGLPPVIDETGIGSTLTSIIGFIVVVAAVFVIMLVFGKGQRSYGMTALVIVLVAGTIAALGFTNGWIEIPAAFVEQFTN